MFNISTLDRVFFIENGYILKNTFTTNSDFDLFADNFKYELDNFILHNEIIHLGGYKVGNLNIDPGKYGDELLLMLKKNNFDQYFEHITNDKIENYNFLAGGNLNFPNSKYQFFHKDGNWKPRMIVVNIATSKINISNGPLQILEKSHIRDYPYWELFFKSFFMKKKKLILNKGDVLIREHRLWHRGTSNNSKNIREMISLMFIKKPNKLNFKKNQNKNLTLLSNVFGQSLYEKFKEYIFIYFKFIFFIYKFIISIIKK